MLASGLFWVFFPDLTMGMSVLVLVLKAIAIVVMRTHGLAFVLRLVVVLMISESGR